MTKRLLTVLLCALYVITGYAQPDPSTLPLLTEAGVTYLGGFRPPGHSLTGSEFTYGGKGVAFNPARNSLFVGNAIGNRIAEISIPTPVKTADPKLMPFATYLQPVFADPMEGHLKDVYAGDTQLFGLMVYGNRLHGAVSIYYEGTFKQQVSHFSRSLDLAQPSFSGWSQVWQADRQGFVGGPMAVVPPEWQAALGGPTVTGQCCIPIISRTSAGPAAFSFDAARVGQVVVPAFPLTYYDAAHRTLGAWEQSNATYGMATRIGGMIIVYGTRTALYFGSNGTGPACYGEGTTNKAIHGTPHPSGNPNEKWCYDPVDLNKGTHAYPYRYQIWAYDLNDWAAVRAGTKNPWDVKPYGVWPLNLPTPPPTRNPPTIGGVGYDPSTQQVYLTQMNANRGSFTSAPVMQVLGLNAKTVPGPIVTPPPPPPPVVTPPPPPPPPVVVPPPPPPAPVPPPPNELETLKAEIVTLKAALAKVEAALAAEKTTSGTLTTEKATLLQRIAEKDALLKQALAK